MLWGLATDILIIAYKAQRIMTNKIHTNMTFTKEIFSLLSENKKFPAYQAERRIDIFINLFLEVILKHYDSKADYKFIAPEFPLRKVSSFQSTKVDYLCLKENSSGEKEILLVELKTDVGSFDEEQCRIYKRYEKWSDCLDGLLKIIIKGKISFEYRLKYFHLIKVLEDKGLVQFERPLPSIRIHENSPNRKEKLQFTHAFKEFIKDNYNCPNYNVKIVYLAPEKMKVHLRYDCKVDMISFMELSKSQFETKYPKEWELLKEIVFDQL